MSRLHDQLKLRSGAWIIDGVAVARDGGATYGVVTTAAWDVCVISDLVRVWRYPSATTPCIETIFRGAL